MQQLTFSINEAQQICRIGRTRLYEAINQGHLKARKFGKKTLILKEDLEHFLNSLPQYGGENE